MVHIVSTDEGKSFTQPQRISPDNWVISGCPHTGPAMTENKTGIHFTWFTGGSSAGIYYNQSKDNGKTFTGRSNVSGKAAKHCQIATLPNDDILIVWNESFSNGGKASSRIGIEQRDMNGNTVRKQYITSETSNASFPLNASEVIVAYTEDINNKEQVFFKQVKLQ